MLLVSIEIFQLICFEIWDERDIRWASNRRGVDDFSKRYDIVRPVLKYHRDSNCVFSDVSKLCWSHKSQIYCE